MAVAMIYPVPEKGGRGKKKTVDETSTLFGSKRLQLARTVLAHSPDLAQAVLAGFKSLDGAYTEARKAKQPLHAQVVGNVRRKVARFKKVAVLPGIACTSPEKGSEIDALEKRPAATLDAQAWSHSSPHARESFVREVGLREIEAVIRAVEPNALRRFDTIEQAWNGATDSERLAFARKHHEEIKTLGWQQGWR